MNKHEILCYGTDASRLKGKAESVFFPKNNAEVQKIIFDSNFGIVPRGAGSNLVGGCVPDNSVVVDMSKMNKVYNFNPKKRIVYAESGVTIKELNEKLRAKGFEFPIELSNQGISTIGGMLATNASGRRSMKYGTMRDWVEEIEFINGKAELIKISKADLMEVCGMEGVTGIITRAKLRIIPIIKRTCSIFQSDNLDEVLSIARKLKSEREIVMLELFSKKVSKLLGFPEKYNMIVEFDSDRGKIKEEEYESLLKTTEKAYYKLASEGYIINEDPKLFFDKIKEFILLLEKNNSPYISYFGAGVIHVFFKEQEKTKREKILEFIKKSQIKFSKFGFGIIRKDFLDSFDERVIQRIKSRLDPFGKMNIGKVIDGFVISPEKTREIEKREETDKQKEIKIEFKENIQEIKSLKEKVPDKKIQEFIKKISKNEKNNKNKDWEDKEDVAQKLIDSTETSITYFDKKTEVSK